MRWVLTSVDRKAGAGDQISYAAHRKWDNGDEDVTTFVGSRHGGPVTVVTQAGAQFHVDDWRQHGDALSVKWVCRFYGLDD